MKRLRRVAAIVFAAAVVLGVGYTHQHSHSNPLRRLEDALANIENIAKPVEPDSAYLGPAFVLEFADELRLTDGQREEVEQLEDDQQKNGLSQAITERRLRALLSDEQLARSDRLRALGMN